MSIPGEKCKLAFHNPADFGIISSPLLWVTLAFWFSYVKLPWKIQKFKEKVLQPANRLTWILSILAPGAELTFQGSLKPSWSPARNKEHFVTPYSGLLARSFLGLELRPSPNPPQADSRPKLLLRIMLALVALTPHHLFGVLFTVFQEQGAP